MMKLLILLLALFLVMPATSILCQDEPEKTRVTVVPMQNAERDERLDVITATVTDTVSLYLKLMRKYRVFIEEELDPYRDISVVRQYARVNGIDNIIFGRAYHGDGGEFVLEMSVYDRYKNSVVLTRREIADGIFEIFDASDRLAVSLVESFSGVHLGFGEIVLTNTGEEGDFTLYLDSDRLGTNILRMDKIINGIHRVEVRQERLLGERTIFQEDIEVFEDGEATLGFSIPYLLAEEKTELEARERRIVPNLTKRETRDDVRREFDELLNLLEDTSFCYRLKEEYDRLWRMKEDWLIEASRWDIEDSFYTIGNPEYDEIFGELKSTYETTQREEIRKGIEKDANYLYNILSIHAAHHFSNKNWEMGVKLYRDIGQMKKSIPCTYYYNFDQESEYVSNVYDEYMKLIVEDKQGDAKRYIESEISNYFLKRMNTVKELFRNQTPSQMNELIVLTDPIGMKVWADGKLQGLSPVKLSMLKSKEVTVKIGDPWFEEVETKLKINNGTNYAFLQSSWKKGVHPFGYGRPISRTAQIMGKGKYELGWKKMESAVGYIVYIGITSGKDRQSIYKKLIMRQNRYLFSSFIGENERYSYRVCAVNDNDIKSPWSNEMGFEGTPKWDFKASGDVHSSPAIGRENTIYIGSINGTLYAIDRGGTLKWSFVTQDAIYSSPTIGRYGNIYFGSTDHKLYALNPDGSLLWIFETDGPIYSSPAIDVSETIYIASWDGYLYAVDMEGRLIWKVPIGSKVSSSPVIDADSVIYIGNNEGVLFAINPDGTLEWKVTTENPILTTAAIGSDGAIYVGSKNGNVFAIGHNGNKKWTYDTGGVVVSSPVIGRDGTIYVNSMDLRTVDTDMKDLANKLFALTQRGRLKWEFNALGSLSSSPAVGADGLVYIGNGKGNVLALGSRGNVRWTYKVASAVLSSPSISRDGTLYIGTKVKRLYAFSTVSKGIADSSWPIFGKNTKHTASAQTQGDEGRVPYKLITVDGNSTDWYGVKPAIDDQTSDNPKAYQGTDIDTVRLAMDSRRLYARIDLSDGPPNQNMPGYYRIGFDSPLNSSLLSIKYEKGWKAEIKRWIEYKGKGHYRTVAYGDVSEGDSFLEAMVPLAGLGVPLPAYIDVQCSYNSMKTALPIDTTQEINLYVPKQKPSEEELSKRWLFSLGAGGYYGDEMYENPNLQNFDLMFGFGYSFGGSLYWGITFDLHPKVNSLTVIYFRNYEKPYHFFDIMILPYNVYTFGYGIGIKHLFLRTKFSYFPEDDENPYSFGIYAGFLF